MSGLFGGGAKTPPAPKPVRQPTPDDAAMRAAAIHAREAAMGRSGRMATILTSQTKQTVGAGGNGALGPTAGAATDEAYG
jgi:hypothetical protein